MEEDRDPLASGDENMDETYETPTRGKNDNSKQNEQ